MTPAPLLREERLVLLINEDRIGRAILLGMLFLVLGVVGTALGFSGRGDTWLPFIGVPIVMVGAIGYVWYRTVCPRCDLRVLAGRRRLPATCPRCGVALLKPATPADAPPDPPVGRSADQAPTDPSG